MDVRAGLYMYDVVVKKFTFAISSPDEFLFYIGTKMTENFVFFFVTPFFHAVYRDLQYNVGTSNAPLEPLETVDVPFRSFIYIAFHFRGQIKLHVSLSYLIYLLFT